MNIKRSLVQAGSVARRKPLGLTILFALLSLVLISCGGSSSGDDGFPGVGSADDGGGSVGPVSTGNGSFNGGLTGRIATSRRGRPMEFDLATGSSRFLPVLTVQETLIADGDGDRTIATYMTGTKEGGYVQTGDQCYFNPGDIGNAIVPSEDSCYAIFNSSFQRTAFVRTRTVEISGAVKLSPSGRYVVFSDLYGFSGERASDTRVLTADNPNSINLVELYTHSVPTNFGSSAETATAWGPNDELAMGVIGTNGRVQIRLTNPTTLEIDLNISLPPEYQSRIRSLDFSPDGRQLVMDIGGAIEHLDLDTLIVTRLATRTIGSLNAPRWSPDGQWIMFVHQTSAPAPVLDINFQATVFPSSQSLYAIPADPSRQVLIGGDTLDGAVLIQSEIVDTPGQFSTRYPGDTALDVPYFDWLP